MRFDAFDASPAYDYEMKASEQDVLPINLGAEIKFGEDFGLSLHYSTNLLAETERTNTFDMVLRGAF